MDESDAGQSNSAPDGAPRRFSHLSKVPLPEDSWEGIRSLLGLSPREMEVGLLVLQGCSDGKIASVLQCSRHTVHSHMRRAYLKLGISNRSAFAAKLFEGHVRLLSAEEKEEG